MKSNQSVECKFSYQDQRNRIQLSDTAALPFLNSKLILVCYVFDVLENFYFFAQTWPINVFLCFFSCMSGELNVSVSECLFLRRWELYNLISAKKSIIFTMPIGFSIFFSFYLPSHFVQDKFHLANPYVLSSTWNSALLNLCKNSAIEALFSRKLIKVNKTEECAQFLGILGKRYCSNRLKFGLRRVNTLLIHKISQKTNSETPDNHFSLLPA